MGEILCTWRKTTPMERTCKLHTQSAKEQIQTYDPAELLVQCKRLSLSAVP